jgi:hypothetical protein
MRRNWNGRNVQLGPGKQTAKTGVWFGEIERKLAKLSKTTFTYRSSSSLFYGETCPEDAYSLTVVWPEDRGCRAEAGYISISRVGVSHQTGHTILTGSVQNV